MFLCFLKVLLFIWRQTIKSEIFILQVLLYFRCHRKLSFLHWFYKCCCFSDIWRSCLRSVISIRRFVRPPGKVLWGPNCSSRCGQGKESDLRDLLNCYCHNVQPVYSSEHVLTSKLKINENEPSAIEGTCSRLGSVFVYKIILHETLI